MDRTHFYQLAPGQFLGDYHNVRGPGSMLKLVQERIIEPVELADPVILDGDHTEWFNQLVRAQVPPHTFSYINKLIVVLQPPRSVSPELLLGWSWDGNWAGLRMLKLKE